MPDNLSQPDFFTETAAVNPNIALPVVSTLPEPEEPVEQPFQRQFVQETITRKKMQRAVLAWLAEQNPTAAAIHVPTRLARFSADAAAFWSEPLKGRLLHPTRTLIIQTCLTRADCWPGCSGKEDVIRHFREKQEEKLALESHIRKTEPELLDTDVLFPEYENWDYQRSSNPAYTNCLHSLSECEQMLYRGTRFELIIKAAIATQQYLAVPRNEIHQNELAAGWGLLYVDRDYSVEVIRKAPERICPLENKLHLSQNIAASSLRDVLFAHGVLINEDGKSVILRPPKRRMKEA